MALARHADTELGRGPTEVLSNTSIGVKGNPEITAVLKTALVSFLIEHGMTSVAMIRWHMSACRLMRYQNSIARLMMKLEANMLLTKPKRAGAMLRLLVRPME